MNGIEIINYQNMLKKKYWKNKNVFVTGATGFLGSWLIKFLADGGANVIALVRDFVPKSNLYLSGYDRKVAQVEGELEDYFLLERALGEYQIDTIFHIGAQTQVEIANRNPISTFETNIRGTWNILEACRRSPLVKKIIVASSDKAYGSHKTLPYDETFALQGSHPYDVSKSAADLISFAYFNTYNLPICVTRCGNLFGGGDLNFNRIVPDVIKSVLNRESPIIRSNGKFTRDYVYVEDAVSAYLLLAEKMDNKKFHGQAFNFSAENPISVIELTNKIISLMKSKVRPKIMNTARGEIPDQYLSSAKARKLLGWQPLYDLQNGLKKTIDWYTAFFKKSA